MTAPTPDVLEALRLPELYRKVCRYAGIPLPPAPAPGERFVLRSGDEPPDLLAKLLEEAFLEDEAEVGAGRPTDPPDAPGRGPGQLAVRPGFGSPCAAVEDLRRAARPGGGPVLVFAVERRDGAGNLLGVTWAAVSEDEPAPEALFRAAVLRHDYPFGPG